MLEPHHDTSAPPRRPPFASPDTPSHHASSAPPQPRNPRQAPAPPAAPPGNQNGGGGDVSYRIILQTRPESPPPPEEPIDPEDAHARIAYGLLIALAGLFLCCLPLGLLAAGFPFSVLREIDKLPDTERETLRRRAHLTLGLALAATLLSLLGYGAAILASC